MTPRKNNVKEMLLLHIQQGFQLHSKFQRQKLCTKCKDLNTNEEELRLA